MSNIIIVDFRDSEDFENHPYISYLKETLNDFLFRASSRIMEIK